MAYERGDNRYNYRYGDNDRWRDRERGNYGRSDWRGRGDRDHDRGFFERAGEEVRSWFSDDDRGRSERGWRGRDEDRRDYGNYGSNWRGDHSTDRYGSGDYGGHEDYDEIDARSADTWGGSGYGGDYQRGRRFDRIDSGSTGTHGAHPMSAPIRGTAYGAGYGATASGYRSSAREEAMVHGGRGGARSGLHDPHYSEWRNRQIAQLDRDYDEYRREHQSKFDQEFAGWREKRQGQRQSLRDVTEHMEVIGSDGEPIGTVDYVRGDRIILTKSDEKAGGHHHSIPCSWIDRVDEKVMVNKTSTDAMAAWRDEDRNRALFERQDQGSEGPHVLNRSFSGTYDR
jgi:hypothetical protein